MKTTAVRHNIFDQDGCLRGMIFISSVIPNGKQGLINFDFKLQWSAGHAGCTERTAPAAASAAGETLRSPDTSAGTGAGDRGGQVLELFPGRG